MFTNSKLRKRWESGRWKLLKDSRQLRRQVVKLWLQTTTPNTDCHHSLLGHMQVQIQGAWLHCKNQHFLVSSWLDCEKQPQSKIYKTLNSERNDLANGTDPHHLLPPSKTLSFSSKNFTLLATINHPKTTTVSAVKLLVITKPNITCNKLRLRLILGNSLWQKLEMLSRLWPWMG